MIQSYPPLASGGSALMPKTDEPSSLAEVVQKSTEYRSQFAWPRHSGDRICVARKSISMGLIKAPDQPDNAVISRPKPIPEVPVHKSITKEMSTASGESSGQDSKKKVKTEYKAKYKPFTSYVYIDGQWKKTSRLVKIPENQGQDTDSHPWYSEVTERLQRANEYKCRGHGHPVYGELLPNIYNQSEGLPLVRPKKDLSEIPIPPVPIEHKKSDVKKKERKEKPCMLIEKKPEKEKKKSAESKRPKSAEPAKSRKPKTQKRPQTAPPPPIKERPPAPAPAHYAYAKRSLGKNTETEPKTKGSGRPPSSRKSKGDSTRSGLPPDGRASRTAHRPPHNSNEKVWLQAGAPSESSSDNFKGKHSDAVRPSVLFPTPPKSNLPAVDDTEAHPVLPKEKEIEKAVESPQAPPAPVPLTHVQTPEEVTGVKSPEPENWTVPLDKGQKLQWTESSTAEPLLPLAKTKADDGKELTTKSLPGVTEPTKAASTSGTSEDAPPQAQSTARMTTADVLERARSRLDQFWGKK